MDDDFFALASLRKRLQVFCEMNVQSILAFEDGLSFKLDAASPAEASKEGVRHLTSSTTCIESLLACPEYVYPKEPGPTKAQGNIDEIAKRFAAAALQREDWKSDDSGDVYCRCRTLPLVIKQVAPLNDEQTKIIKAHIEYIFTQVSVVPGEEGAGQERSADPTWFGIGERDINNKPSDSYPANAYHSYWALATLKAAQHKKIDTGVTRQTRDAVLLWARMKLGTEIALHSADSALLDSDQLAWATAIFIAFTDSVKVNLAEQDLVRQAFKCLFATQTESGTWRHYQPLFHYKKSGNAYCYNFETFATLLKVILDRYEEGAFYLDALRPYLKNLTRLFEYAERSQRPLQAPNSAAWNSGHRSNSAEPESWATASVYLYAQGLRRCVGIWTRSAALADFPTVAVPDRARAKDDIVKRGNSWSEIGRPSVAEQLQTSFVNPFQGIYGFHKSEPDACPIADDQPRSAILFGPPGTSKTTLARAVAGQLGWRYVELHSSHFVSEGLSGVQKVADRIFGRLMQLDHAVVLFDEVDELVHSRDDGGSDQLSRFLTTSMLPRLAELWKQRRVIYFVNTNYITYFDSAITRSQRFDALIFVPPSSFDAKRSRLLNLIEISNGTIPAFRVTQDEVDKCFAEVCKRRGSKIDSKALLSRKEALAKFKLIRWDQLSELAEILLDDTEASSQITAAVLAAALDKIHDAELKKVSSYARFEEGEAHARRDYERVPTYEIDPDKSDAKVMQAFRESKELREANGSLWLKRSLEGINRKCTVERVGDDGRLALRPGSRVLRRQSSQSGLRGNKRRPAPR